MDQDVRTFDDVEELMIGMMESATLTGGVNTKYAKKRFGLGQGLHAGSHVLRNETMKPKDAYTFDMSCPETDENHRLFTTSTEYLVRPAWETLDDHAEVVMLDPSTGILKWEGFRKRRTMPKGAMTVGRPHVIYEHHIRMIGGDVPDVYAKDLLAFNSKAETCPILYANASNLDNHEVFEAAVCAASMLEDAHRKDAFLASVFDQVIVRFPVGIGAHKDFFSEREAPMTPSGRRRAILHWVKKHQRRNSDHVTEPYMRGVKEISMDGIRVTLEAF